ncbi:MAG: hypothetical protein M3478_03370, partial [Planctomycetota bacterium]|nr:hypothetical protein [Planctomycetota bacterium]
FTAPRTRAGRPCHCYARLTHALSGDARELTLYNLNHAPAYHFRIDAINDGGVTRSSKTADVP